MTDYWKSVAIKRLGQYNTMTQTAQALPMTMRQWRCDRQARGEKELNLLAMKTELRQELSRVRLWISQTEAGLAALTPQERLVVQLLCISPDVGNVQRLCGLLGCEQSTVYRRRDKALEKFTKALYGRS